MLDRIILNNLQRQDNAHAPNPMQEDAFEKARTYKGWPWPLRYLLALRYLQRKREMINNYHLRRIYPIPKVDFQEQLIRLLTGEPLIINKLHKTKQPKQETSHDLPPVSQTTPRSHLPLWTWLLRSFVLYPLLIMFVIGTGWIVSNYIQTQRMEKMLANDLIQYADLLHRNIENQVTNDAIAAAQLQQKADIVRQEIINALPEKGQLKTKFNRALQSMGQTDIPNEQIIDNFTAVNVEMDRQGLKYYIAPRIYVGSCASFMTLPFEWHLLIKDLFAKRPKLNTSCKTIALIVYKVNKRQLFFHEGDPLPIFYTTRLDRLPVSESALGLTHYRGLGSLVLTDRIHQYSTDSLMPALTRQGRKLITPFWTKGNYSVEEAVAGTYQKAFEAIYQDDPENKKILKRAAKTLISFHEYMARSQFRHSLLRVDSNTTVGGGDNLLSTGLEALSMVWNEEDEHINDPVLGELPAIKPLKELIIQSVAYHEAFHQVRNKEGWKEPKWAKRLLNHLDHTSRDRVVDELEAYLVQLYYADKIHNIVMSHIFFFSLNVLMDNEAEHYASKIMLPALDDVYRGKTNFQPRVLNRPLKLFTIFKKLIDDQGMPDKRLSKMAGIVYSKLFGREIPHLKKPGETP
jgi:hypothetical protein